MIFGWSKNDWIFNYLINWVNKLSWTIFFLFITLSATIIPEYIYFARLTIPNFPYPSLFKILKFSLLKPLPIFILSGDFVMFLIKEGIAFYDLQFWRYSVVVVEAVYFNRLLVLPPEFLALKYPNYFYWSFELPLRMFRAFYQFTFLSEYNWLEFFGDFY